MAIPTRGSRPLRVGDVDYRWVIRRSSTYAQAIAQTWMSLAVEQAGEGPRTVLVVDLGVRRADNWMRPNGTGITPGVVEDVVIAARAAGWAPAEAGRTFLFEHRVITDSIGYRRRASR